MCADSPQGPASPKNLPIEIKKASPAADWLFIYAPTKFPGISFQVRPSSVLPALFFTSGVTEFAQNNSYFRTSIAGSDDDMHISILLCITQKRGRIADDRVALRLPTQTRELLLIDATASVKFEDVSSESMPPMFSTLLASGSMGASTRPTGQSSGGTIVRA